MGLYYLPTMGINYTKPFKYPQINQPFVHGMPVGTPGVFFVAKLHVFSSGRFASS